MAGYWIRHRLFLTIILSAVIASVAGLLFVAPYFEQLASNYNDQSIYKNSEIDFIAPEPSFEQVDELVNSYGIEKIFPFYLTKIKVNVNDGERTTTVLLSDKIQNIDITMYNDSRLIKKMDKECTNPILVDWKFCKETSSTLGDKVSFAIGGVEEEYTISAIYETNNIYDGGAILVQLSDEQKKSISDASKNSGYSGMYISASDYNACRTYLTTEYRPLGRLKSREQFDSDDQYQVHYDAIMSSAYANEITDFRIRENEKNQVVSSMMIWIGSIISCVLIVLFNVVMSKRGCEKNYFSKQCIPKGQNVRPYYVASFIWEIILGLVVNFVILAIKYILSEEFVSLSLIDIKIAAVPCSIIVGEIICIIMNFSMINSISRKTKK